MADKQTDCVERSEHGVSAVEVTIVVAIIIIISAIALPQLLGARRHFRFHGLAQEVVNQMRQARQQAMSQRQVMRFRYNDTNKTIVIIDSNDHGTPADPLATTTEDRFADAVLPRITMLQSSGVGVSQPDITCGVPGGAPTIPTTLADTTTQTSMTTLPALAGQAAVNGIEVIFQPDGSVVNAAGVPLNSAIYIYDSQNARGTLRAISVLGASGRVKLWRYNENGNTFEEQ